MSGKEIREKPACSMKSAPRPAGITCPQCGRDVEIWTDEDQVTCEGCGRVITRDDIA